MSKRYRAPQNQQEEIRDIRDMISTYGQAKTPDEKIAAATRSILAEISHYNRYGGQKLMLLTRDVVRKDFKTIDEQMDNGGQLTAVAKNDLRDLVQEESSFSEHVATLMARDSKKKRKVEVEEKLEELEDQKQKLVAELEKLKE